MFENPTKAERRCLYFCAGVCESVWCCDYRVSALSAVKGTGLQDVHLSLLA